MEKSVANAFHPALLSAPRARPRVSTISVTAHFDGAPFPLAYARGAARL
jgi:hypothetical protein